MLKIQDSHEYVDDNKWQGENGELLEVENLIAFDPEIIQKDQMGLWRYISFLPLNYVHNKVSLNEGFTPIIDLKYPNKKIHAKLEFLFPTGSYKDRGATFLLSKCKELGIKKIVEDSSGNAGCAIAAYASRAGIECTIVIPANTSAAKVNQIISYGAHVEKVEGNRKDATDRALELAKDTYFASHCYNPWFFQGTMTFAFEIWEQKIQVDEIIFPTGNGTLLLGAFMGFKKLLDAGCIEKIPKISAAQADACAPLFAAWKGFEFKDPSPTLAEGITVQNPIRKKEILAAIQQSGGQIYTLTEAEILNSYKQMCLEGIYAEYTSAVAHAAIAQSKEDEILIPITGSGMKNKNI